MKANAPDKLYLSKNIYGTYLYQVPDPDDDSAVEYTRTDIFIENACAWFRKVKEQECGFDGVDSFITHFKEAMKL